MSLTAKEQPLGKASHRLQHKVHLLGPSILDRLLQQPLMHLSMEPLCKLLTGLLQRSIYIMSLPPCNGQLPDICQVAVLQTPVYSLLQSCALASLMLGNQASWCKLQFAMASAGPMGIPPQAPNSQQFTPQATCSPLCTPLRGLGSPL